MKTIKVASAIVDIKILYKKASTSAQRALLGYMIKTGVVKDSIFGGAFNLLHRIEWCMEGDVIYTLYPLEDNETTKKIIHVAQLALDGEFDDFSIKVKEIENIVKCMNNNAF
jgi:hypothetical protein